MKNIKISTLSLCIFILLTGCIKETGLTITNSSLFDEALNPTQVVNEEEQEEEEEDEVVVDEEPVIYPPTVSNFSPTSFREDTASTIDLNYSDLQNKLATSCAVDNLTNITITSACVCISGSCSVGVQGLANYNGSASFTYTVTTESGTSTTATASLTINDDPIFVIVGFGGKSSYSLDFSTWVTSDHNLHNIQAMSFNNGRISITGTAAGGVYAIPPVAYSDDFGKTWTVGSYTACTPAAARAIYNLENFNGEIVGIGWNSGLLFSNDGINFDCAPRSGTTGSMYASHVANNRLIAVGGYTRVNRMTKYTDDGVNWTDVVPPGDCNTLQSVYEANNRWIAVGANVDVADTSINGVVCYSDNDGVSWSQRALGFNISRLEAVIFANNRWVALGTDTGIYSDDNGDTWTSFNFNLGSIKNMKFYNNKFYAVGTNGLAMSSVDGINWTASNHNNSSAGYKLLIITD